MNKYIFILGVFLSLLLLGSCSTVKLPPTYLYTIKGSIPSEKTAVKADLNKVLKIAIPRSTAAIMSRNILYQDSSFSLNAYAFSKWIDTPNRMLASLFLTAIKDSSAFTAVLPSDSIGNSDFVLESSLQLFHQQIHKDETSSGHMQISVYLIESRTGTVRAVREFFSKIKSTSLDAKGGVEALNKAASDISIDITEWLVSLSL